MSGPAERQHNFNVVADLPRKPEILDQRRWLPDRARGARVAHLGCVDHPLTAARIGTGELLHEQLAKTATSLLGVDISESGLDELARLVPGDYLAGDIEELDQLALPDVDLVIAAEVIEHLPSPGRFLVALRKVLARQRAIGIITTPNAYSWRSMAEQVLRRREVVHPDHTLVYTAATFVHAAEVAGLNVDRLRLHTWSERGSSRKRAIGLVDDVLLRWNPYLSVGLVLEVSAPTPGGDR